MTLPFVVPSWLPWWALIAVLVPVLLYACVFLLMPFSVFGLKGRLDSLEARLDEIQGEIRALVLRLPEPGWHDPGEAEPPPIPPVRARLAGEPLRTGAPLRADAPVRTGAPGRNGAPDSRARPTRAEPRLDWPR